MNNSFSSSKTILLTCLAVWLIAVVLVIITSSLIIKFYLGIDDGVKTWLYIGYAVRGSIEVSILLFGIFAVNRQHYGYTVGFTSTQILSLIMTFSYLIRFSLSGSFFVASALVFLMELIIVILCILYAIRLENDNKIFLCIKYVLLTLFSISLIAAVISLILVYTFLIISILKHTIDVSWILAAISIVLFTVILILIGGIMAIHGEHFCGCIAFTVCYTIFSILNLIYLCYNEQQCSFEIIHKILIISLQTIVIVFCISYIYLIRKRQIIKVNYKINNNY